MGSPFRRLHAERAIPAPTINVDAISDVTVPRAGILRVYVSTAAGSVVNLMLNPSDAAEQTVPLKENGALDGAGVFDVPVEKDDVVNLQVETSVALHYVVLDLIYDGSA